MENTNTENRIDGLPSSLTHTANDYITTDVAHVSPEGQGSDTASFGELKNYARSVGLAVSSIIAPSVATITTTAPMAATTIATSSASAITATEAAASFPVVVKVGAGLLGAGLLAGCEKDAVDPNAIDRSTDNPAHMAEFMKDVKPAILYNGTAKLTFEAVWVANTNGKGGEYKLKPIPVIDFTRVKELLEFDAQKNNIPLDKMSFGFYYRGNSSVTGLSFAIPYSYIISKTGEQTMRFEDFKQFITSNSEGNPSQTISKKDIGFLRISTLSNKNVENEVLNALETLNPYTFGN